MVGDLALGVVLGAVAVGFVRGELVWQRRGGGHGPWRGGPPAGWDVDWGAEVVGLVGEGLSNEEIAARLVVSPATARTHVSRVMVKLGARDRAQLVVFAFRAGLVR